MMFFDNKHRVFRKLKSILRDLQVAESDLNHKNFEQALKELRKGFLENKKFIDWLNYHKSDEIDVKDLTYGSDNLNQQISQAQNLLMSIKEHYNSNNEDKYQNVLELVKQMEKLLVWELKSSHGFTKHNVDVLKKSQDDLVKKVKEADRKLAKIIQKYDLLDPVDYITITNKKPEEKKFMEAFNKGEIYNPQFKYKATPSALLSKVEQEVKDVMAELKSFDLSPIKGVAYLVEKKRINIQIILRLIRSIGSPKVTKYSKQLYSFPSNEMVHEAYKGLRKGKQQIQKQFEKKVLEKRYSAEDLAEKINEFFKENDMKWTAIVKTNNDLNGRWKTVNSRTELWINEDEGPFSEKDIMQCLEHEVKVHAYRYESGRKSPLKILAFGTSGYLPTEEGLTTYLQDLKGIKNPNIVKNDFMYVISEYIADSRQGSFYNCFSHLTELGVEPEAAYKAVLRIKRGLSNTAQPGGFFKDHVYFLGERIVEKFIKSGGKISDLQLGKIGINDIKHMTKINTL